MDIDKALLDIISISWYDSFSIDEDNIQECLEITKCLFSEWEFLEEYEEEQDVVHFIVIRRSDNKTGIGFSYKEAFKDALDV